MGNKYQQLTEKQLADLRAMRQASKHMSHQMAVAEQIGAFTMRRLHPGKTLLQKILRR